MAQAVIAALGRSAIGKAPKGSLRYTRPEDVGAQVLKGVLDRLPVIREEEIGDVVIGCAYPEAEQGGNMGKVIAAKAIPGADVPGMTLNRFCSSGLQSISVAANAIMAGQADIMIAGGVEFMSAIPMGGNMPSPNPDLVEKNPDAFVSMGITAENVAEEFGVTREEQDAFSVESHRRADRARREGKFAEEIIPVDAVTPGVCEKGFPAMHTRIFREDEGIRPDTSLASLSKLRTVFKVNGTVTAGNSSQTSDGAAMAVLMSDGKAEKLGIRPLAAVRSFAVAGVPSRIMGTGPVRAIPKALALAGLSLRDIGLFELNEAFASQAIACIHVLGLDREIVNVNGGAIALGHPLGCTGTLLTVKLVCEMRRRGVRYGVVSMCVGGGMGAAAVFERLD